MFISTSPSPSLCRLAGVLILLAAATVDATAQKIVHPREINGEYELFVVDVTSGVATPLTTAEVLPGSKWEVQWSPDGTRVAFSVTTEGGLQPSNDSDWIVYVINADGSGLTAVANSDGQDYSPRWSPDGAQLLFISTRAGRSHIFKADADGSNVQQLTFGNPYDYAPQWSPDGSQILYLSSLITSQIHVMDADGSNDQAITGSDMYHEFAKFSPDGTRIAFRGTSAANIQNSDIFVIDVGGTGLLNLTNDPAVRDDLPAWSPDGTQIVFQTGLPAQIAVVNADGTDLRAVTQGGNNDVARWSSDGSTVLFYRAVGNGELFSANPDGSNLQQLTMSSSSARDFDVFGSFAQFGPPAIFEGGVILSTLAPKVDTISPLSIISVVGENFSEQTILFPTLDGAGDLNRILGGACLEMNGERLPMFAVTPGQINAQASEKKMLGPATFRVISDCETASAVSSETFRLSVGGVVPREATSEVEMATVEEATPGFFLYEAVGTAGLIAARFNADNVAIAPMGMFTDQFGPSRPAEPGDVIVLYGTGWGETTAGLAAGELAPIGASPLLPEANPTVTFGGVVIDAIYVGATPQAAGLYQLAITVPANAQPGDNQVVLTAYGRSTPVGPVIPVVVP